MRFLPYLNLKNSLNFRHSLRFRIVAACVLFALVVNLSYGYLVLFVAEISEDELFNWHIAQQTQQLLDSHDFGSLALASNEKIHGDRQVFIGSEAQLLAGLQQWAQSVGAQPMGLPQENRLSGWKLIENTVDTAQGYRLFELSHGPFNMHIVRAPLHSSPAQYFFYLVDISEFNRDATYSAWGASVLILASVAVTLLLALLVGWRVARRVVLPLTRLSEEVAGTRVEETAHLQGGYYRDEVGLLGERIDGLLQRIGQFVSREKAFARDASHELRTPVTSSQMALELINTLPQSQGERMRPLLARVERANRDMTHLIESFLLLGKEQEKGEPAEPCRPHELAQAALDKHAYVLGDKPIERLNQLAADTELQQPPRLLTIVINNLVRNAFQYTVTGRVTISGDASAIAVEDTGPGFAEGSFPRIFKPYETNQAEGLGLGLNIVQRICQLRGWTLEIDSTATGSCIRVVF